MTALCGGGASAARPGFNNTVVLTAAAVEGALTLFGLEPVAAILAPFLASEVYDLTNFCTIDPPTDPGLTSADVIDVLNFADPTVNLPALNKVRQWFNSRYWYQICQCTSVSTPAPPALSSPGTPTTNGGLPPQGNTPCFAGSITDHIQRSSVAQQHDLTGSLLPTAGPAINGTGIVIGSSAGLTANVYPIPSTVSQVDIFHQVLEVDPAVAGGGELKANFYVTNASGVQLHSTQLVSATSSSSPATASFPLSDPFFFPSGSTHWGIGSITPASAAHSPSDQAIGLATTVTCTGPALGETCCPPDPHVMQTLTQIHGLLQAVYALLGSSVHSYVDGTIHSGLTDHGTVTVDPLAIAIKVNITTLPTYIGQAVGAPPYLFDAGFITPANTKGPTSPERLQFSTQVFVLPILPAAVDFTLAPGVVIDITELKAGP